MRTCDVYNMWNTIVDTYCVQLISFDFFVGWMGTCEAIPLGMQS
jgi:hypothetical protein